MGGGLVTERNVKKEKKRKERKRYNRKVRIEKKIEKKSFTLGRKLLPLSLFIALYT